LGERCRALGRDGEGELAVILVAPPLSVSFAATSPPTAWGERNKLL
jgi:hypothetical protein